MGTSPRLINIDPNSRSSTVQDGHHEEEGRAEVQAARHPHPHPSQASVDHPGPSSTALRHGANLQVRTARQSQPSSVVVNSASHIHRGGRHLADSTSRESECLEVGRQGLSTSEYSHPRTVVAGSSLFQTNCSVQLLNVVRRPPLL